MKKVLCFGDSNTFGFIPGSGQRYDKHTRWTGILQELTHGKFEIIEAGCNNRTCFINNPAGREQTGYKVLPDYLDKKLDYIILAIGINDIQFLFNPSLDDIEKGIINLINITKSKCPLSKIILVSPSKLTQDVIKGYFSCQFDETSIEKSFKFADIYRQVAEKYNCIFINLDTITKVSPIDGLHYAPEEHRKIAYAINDVLCADALNLSNVSDL